MPCARFAPTAQVGIEIDEAFADFVKNWPTPGQGSERHDDSADKSSLHLTHLVQAVKHADSIAGVVRTQRFRRSDGGDIIDLHDLVFRHRLDVQRCIAARNWPPHRPRAAQQTSSEGSVLPVSYPPHKMTSNFYSQEVSVSIKTCPGMTKADPVKKHHAHS
jgi:hypothetical protein